MPGDTTVPNSYNQTINSRKRDNQHLSAASRARLDEPLGLSSALVLVVDDDPTIRQLLLGFLADVGFRATAVEDGASALAAIRQEPPDLILLDVNLPDMDGLAVCRELRASPFLAHIPVVMMTAGQDPVLRSEAMRTVADDFVDKPFDLNELEARLVMNLRRALRDRQANPLTGLPGNQAIEAAIAAAIAENDTCAVAYLDIDNFKSYNDRYGFHAGDGVLRLVAEIVRDSIEDPSFGLVCRMAFTGHLGGDDFVLVLPTPCVENVCRGILRRFDARVASLYSAADRRRGGVLTQDRRGTTCFFPLMSLSIAVVVTHPGEFHHVGQIVAIAAEIKAYLKKQPGSNYLIDRRSPRQRQREGQEFNGATQPDN